METYSVTDRDIQAWWPIPAPAGHKYTRGVLGVVTGSRQYPGAALLGVGAALACGPGMVRYLGDSPLVVPRYPEVVTAPGQVQAWLAGSGMVPDSSDFSLVHHALASGLPVVLDAGAFTLAYQGQLSPVTVLTPHPGELAQLLRARGHDVTRTVVERNLVDYAHLAAQETGAVVAATAAIDVVAHPDNYVYIQEGATPWRGTAGAGDVYAGIVGALLTLWEVTGRSSVSAGWIAAAATHLHGRAANLAARAHDGVGYPIKASNISDALGEVIWQVLNS
ncbi:ADP-dependent NAD(P)H-hydrate dehydratase [Arcanobacterium phocae]|uniref:ADP-dependent NAD(P)H-hydrate dehydratase n=1 Tax=Arcanobacterium phocae TaxID=131112 RepID=UPI001C12033C|nr:ADP/ATP-dependent (S)-NAD(P)H-hydrate dehydratase [Arcanobacterium phocae]